MPGSKRSRVWIPAPDPGATPPPPAAAPPLRPPLPPARAAASSGDALVKGRGGADGCRVQSMAMADLLVQEQPIDDDAPDAEVGESSETDTPFRGGVFQTESEKTVLLGKDSIQ
ncbi:uncharacterized protein LOC125515571 [Triticum urartu]|uniref:uncharacterized protein LOC125515571 n=1 Tax=Triticum urartu TaxID=4572 RepID=UPI002044B6F8|nr:uncharacterized protein LOC125515571 [Triticum urartu]XP_048537022.1 uncharacterized protein LOC125515571 [Triticum urartu]